MERLMEVLAGYADLFVPMLAVWAIACLYTSKSGCRCRATEICYFLSLLLIAFCTVRTVAANHDCWLVHTASLGCMIVGGAMKRPIPELSEFEVEIG